MRVRQKSAYLIWNWPYAHFLYAPTSESNLTIDLSNLMTISWAALNEGRTLQAYTKTPLSKLHLSHDIIES